MRMGSMHDAVEVEVEQRPRAAESFVGHFDIFIGTLQHGASTQTADFLCRLLLLLPL